MFNTSLSGKVLFIFMGLLLSTSSSWAGWTTTPLHPSDNYFFSGATSVSGGQIGGFSVVDVNLSKVYHPVYWNNNSVSSFKDLYDGYFGSVFAINNGIKAGYRIQYGSIWSTTDVQSHVTVLNYPENSYIYALSNGWASGNMTYYEGENKTPVATLWKLTSNGTETPTILDSNPSLIYGMTGASGSNPGIQVGQTESGAALWKGTAESKVDLNPADSINSAARAAFGDQQGGWFQDADGKYHAVLWSGTADSYVDLMPSLQGVTDSLIFGKTDGVAVGDVYFSSDPGAESQAFLWWDSATSYINLQDLLPSQYTYSRATAADWYNGQLWVVGAAWNNDANREEAMLWTYSPNTVPEPSTFLLLGTGLGGLALLRKKSKK